MVFTYFSIVIISLSIISVLIIVGAIASNKWQFNFSYVSFISVAIYLATSYWATRLLTPMAGISILGLIGLFEATIGFKLALKFKANLEEIEGELPDFLSKNTAPPPALVLLMVLVYLFIGWIGTLFVC
ncbi:MAG: Unknown protein [uncultured Aureispira sp.]|uniref:Uncharacterized protein n=1 Tax=uncultured Aureispira sp. TaxID=1331704 RepID=A0A6S6TYQ8_9BACT|nr:MAG: Unknown protein [uncultured Aureispira sp.]